MSRCKFVSTTEPRILPGRHGAQCPQDRTETGQGGDDSTSVGDSLTGCAGCLTCPELHCGNCGHRHCDDAHPLTCPKCVGFVRDDLAQIEDMYARLEGEAIARGSAGDRDGTVLGGDAMVLLAMTYADQTGKRAEDHEHERKGDPVPPLVTLGTWEDCWRDHLGHEVGPKATISNAVGYLDLMLTRMAQVCEVPFEEFARDIRRARGGLEDVLHDGIRRETGAPCPKCAKSLVKDYGRTVAFDKWKCPNRECKAEYADAEYRKYVTDDYRANADKLTAVDIEAEYRVPAGTVRVWANRNQVRKRGKDTSGRQLYDVSDMLAMRDLPSQKEPA